MNSMGQTKALAETFYLTLKHRNQWGLRFVVYPPQTTKRRPSLKCRCPFCRNCRLSRQETVRYYHTTKKCLTNRFLFFRLTTWKFLMMLNIAFEIHTRSISQASLGWHSNKMWDYVPVCERTFLVLVPQLPYNSFKLSVVKSWAKAA